jgi:hypothetical protein
MTGSRDATKYSVTSNQHAFFVCSVSIFFHRLQKINTTVSKWVKCQKEEIVSNL